MIFSCKSGKKFLKMDLQLISPVRLISGLVCYCPPEIIVNLNMKSCKELSTSATYFDGKLEAQNGLFSPSLPRHSEGRREKVGRVHLLLTVRRILSKRGWIGSGKPQNERSRRDSPRAIEKDIWHNKDSWINGHHITGWKALGKLERRNFMHWSQQVPAYRWDRC